MAACARQGLEARFEEFSLTAAAARHGRMLLPDAAIEGFGFTDYGYHLPAIPTRPGCGSSPCAAA